MFMYQDYFYWLWFNLYLLHNNIAIGSFNNKQCNLRSLDFTPERFKVIGFFVLYFISKSGSIKPRITKFELKADERTNNNNEVIGSNIYLIFSEKLKKKLFPVGWHKYEYIYNIALHFILKVGNGFFNWNIKSAL